MLHAVWTSNLYVYALNYNNNGVFDIFLDGRKISRYFATAARSAVAAAGLPETGVWMVNVIPCRASGQGRAVRHDDRSAR